MTTEMSTFATTVYKNKYAHSGEEWEDTARRVVETVVKPYFPEDVEELTQFVIDRKFMPGGRYLYATGKPFHQTQNCLLMTVEDSREGWADLMQRITSGLMTGAGVGVVYSKLRGNGAPVKGMGGKSTGPLALMNMVNEAGRHIMQGGSRRSAIWAGLHWNHPDVFDFIKMKNWSDDIKALKEKDFNAVAPLDMTNISVILDDDFFAAFENEDYYVCETNNHYWAKNIYWAVVEQMLSTGEPGFSIDIKENAGEHLRNAPVAPWTYVLTSEGYKPVSELVGIPSAIWTGQQFAQNVVFKETSSNSPLIRVTMTGGRVIDCSPEHPFMIDGKRIAAKNLTLGTAIDVSLPVSFAGEFNSKEYTLGWVYGDGSFTVAGGADLTLCSNESKECLPWISGYNSINLEDSRGFTRMYFSVGYGIDRTKETVAQSEITASFVAGLFDADGNWSASQKRIRLASKHESFLRDIRRGLEAMGIMAHVSKAGHSTYGNAQTYQLVIAAESMQRFAAIIPTKRIKPELEGYKAYRQSKIKVLAIENNGFSPVYCADVQVPEHSFVAEGVVISNCTEISSSDDNDICNLGSINLARVTDLSEMIRVTELATRFLLCGTIYSKVPYQAVADTREKNRRLGLGLMGIYEWLAVRGKSYAPDRELETWLEVYATSTQIAAAGAAILGVSAPIKTRAVAPTGTIGIIAETTTGLEPPYGLAYKRRYLKGTEWFFQYVIEPLAKRFAEQGIDVDTLETAFSLAQTPEKRLEFQAWLQKYVDHGIASTVNLPAKNKQEFTVEEFGTTLMKYLPELRGVTVYPDGSRGGQPLTVVPYSEAVDWEGYEYEEWSNDNSCAGGTCGL